MECEKSASAETDMDTFEYNNHLAEDAQAIWLAEWLKQKRIELDLNTNHVAKNTDYIKKLADLFKESYEVGLKILFRST